MYFWLYFRLQSCPCQFNEDKRQIQISKIQVSKRKGRKTGVTSHLQEMSENVFALREKEDRTIYCPSFAQRK